ncbi:Major Facilitator Superfamily protein OS=Streptomyces microflavus OX=1919 GN=Smic_86740 PE=4 SV=1 [Streptomyces microflavus]
MAQAVRDAFMSGFTSAMGVVAVILALAALLCLLRAPRHADDAAETDATDTEATGPDSDPGTEPDISPAPDTAPAPRRTRTR